MQLHRLRLTAIGPFADPVEIDIDKVSASGIFLLDGPTGAGKSTLIDAIVFALYGDVAARDSSAERIASAVAPDGVTPSVELDFSTSHGMFRIRRTPKHSRAKRRGTGRTAEHASGSLWRLVSPDAGAAGEPIATRLDEIGDEVLRIVGLSREQFVQTVVLPQGEFATFLRADAEHRRALLQKLFGTAIYERTVERLVELRRAAYQQRSAAATTVLSSLSAYSGAAALSRSGEEALLELVAGEAEECLAVIHEQLDAMAAALLRSQPLLAAAGERAQLARACFAELSRRDAAQHRVQELQQQLKAFDQGAATFAADAEHLSKATVAAQLMPPVVGLDEARARAMNGRAAMNAASSALPDPTAAVDDWPSLERRCTAQAAALEPLLEVETGLTEARTRLETLRDQRAGLDRRCLSLMQAVAEAPASVATIREALDADRSRAATLDDARMQLDTAKAMLRSVGELARLADRVDLATAERAALAGEATRLVKHEARLRVLLIDGMVGNLAAQLEPERPCPVCGSLEHPDPASWGEPVDRANVDRASDDAAVATRRLEAAQQQLMALESAAAELRGVAAARSIDQAEAELADAERRVATAEAAQVQALQLQHELVEAERLFVEQQAQLHVAESTKAAVDARIATTEQTLARDEKRVAAALDGHDSLSVRAATLADEAAHWRAALEALNGLRAAESDVAVRSVEVEGALTSSAFSNVAEVRAAYLDAEEIERLRKSLESQRRARAACEAELASPELLSVDPTAAVDLESARTEVEQAEQDLSDAQGRHGQLSQRLAESRERSGEVQGSLSAQRAVIEATIATIRMADLASASGADNAKSMSLPTFVLRERFVDVVASANERLGAMSDGRYRLAHVEDRRGNRKSGLELQIRDAHIDHPRDPSTLSGGESFYCSLALALGLADVVTAEAGGVDLGTLFVDEGFGSLDTGTLEQVLDVLHGLASSGRVVGIVSHVPELKEQVAERISVVPNGDGSSRLIVAA